MRKFICISGKAQNGKDTTAAFLTAKLQADGYKVLVAHQADLLKYICKTFFGWNGKKDEYGRTLLQRVGTDVIRKVNPDFWVNFMEEVTGFFNGEWDYIIIPDTRFPNEIERLRTHTSQAIHVRITRSNFQSPLTEEQQGHISETALDNYLPNCIIFNDGSLDELSRKVDYLAHLIEQGQLFPPNDSIEVYTI